MAVVYHFLRAAGGTLFQIRAGAEGLVSRAGEDDNLDVLALIEFGPQGKQFQTQRAVNRIERGRAVQCNPRDTVFDGEQMQRGSGHVRILWQRMGKEKMRQRASSRTHGLYSMALHGMPLLRPWPVALPAAQADQSMSMEGSCKGY